MAATESKPLLDVLTLDKPEQLKALGHPLRLRVLETLGAADTRAHDEPRARRAGSASIPATSTSTCGCCCGPA